MPLPSSVLPTPLYSYHSKELRTSGSQSSIRRRYLYSSPQYECIENHHWWRIESAHGLEEPGIVFDLGYSPTYLQHEEYRESYISDYDGVHDPTGRHNTHKLIWYRRNTGSSALVETLQEARDQNPKIVMCSPSQIEFLYARSEGKVQFDCPLISTRETLYPHVRKMALKMFPKVIDKMRCWDGGLTFYECAEGRLHVCDELCHVEQLDDGLLACTDYFNFSTPFLRYLNGDAGSLACGHCSCGVYGNYLTKFDGASRSLIWIGDYAIPGSLVVEDINSLFEFGGCASNVFSLSMIEKYHGNPFEGYDILYRVIQHKDESIEFLYHSKPSLGDTQLAALRDGLNFIFYRQVSEGLTIHQHESAFMVAPKPLAISADPDLMSHTRGARHKSRCVESHISKGV